MDTIEGKIILKCELKLTPGDILEAEQYINSTLASIIYANRSIGLRVHFEYPIMGADDVRSLPN